MRKSMSLAFGFSLLFILLMNFLFFIIAYSTDGTINAQFNAIAENPYYLCYILAQPMGHFPWDIVGWINSSTYTDADNLRFGLMLLTIIGGAIIAGLAGGSIKNAVIGWVITGIILVVLIAISVYNVDGVITIITGSSSTSVEETMVWVVLRGVFNIILYGLLTALVALVVGKSKSY